MKVLADSSLPNVKKYFNKPFTLSLYDDLSQVKSLITEAKVLLCRSTLKVNADLLASSDIEIVATASSGVDHIDKDYLAANNIVLMDAKGSNARSVVDYVIACIAYLEQIKKLSGGLVGVVGVGEVGSRLVPQLLALGFQVICFDPFVKDTSLDDYLGDFIDLLDCDLICIHANLHENLPFPSKNLFNLDILNKLKPGAVIINAARGGIVNEQDLLATTNKIIYCTDVYCNEPNIDHKIVDLATICTPHIAGHSIEAKKAAVSQVAYAIRRHYNVSNLDNSFCLEVDKQLIDKLKFKVLVEKNDWQDKILNLYNPYIETIALKQAIDKSKAFLQTRLAHKYRHNFNMYNFNG